MKKFIFSTLLLLSLLGGKAYSQEYHGNTLNIGLGIGYYGYLSGVSPVLHFDYEFEVAPQFTIAPFITALTYRSYYYWGGPGNPYQNYYYRYTVIPVGAKFTYYFDGLLDLNDRWDLYAAGSLGFAIRSTRWETPAYGGTVVRGASGLYLDVHVGAEYHATERLGLFLDLSSGISTFGLGIHF